MLSLGCLGRPKAYDREALVSATTQLFWRQGLSETSLVDIEKSTGVNKSSLYSEFEDKDDIFVASLSHYIQSNGVYEILDRRPLGRANVVEFLNLGKSCAGQRRCFVANSLRESAILPQRARDLIHEYIRKVKAKLEANRRRLRERLIQISRKGDL